MENYTEIIQGDIGIANGVEALGASAPALRPLGVSPKLLLSSPLHTPNACRVLQP